MSEILPPSEPSFPPPPPISKRKRFWKNAGIGALIFVASAILCWVSFYFLLVGFLGAFFCIFFDGRESIFAGYMIAVGLFLLCATIYCFAQPLHLN